MKAILSAGAILAGVALTGGQACAATDIGFPTDPGSRPTVERWINQNLDLTGFTATGWSTNALFFTSIRDLNLTGYPTVRTAVWVEVIDSTAALERGWRSSVSKIEFDCETRRYRELSHQDYAEAGRRGPARNMISAGTWRTVEPDTTMDTTVDEVCYRARSAMDVYAKGARAKPK